MQFGGNSAGWHCRVDLSSELLRNCSNRISCCYWYEEYLWTATNTSCDANLRKCFRFRGTIIPCTNDQSQSVFWIMDECMWSCAHYACSWCTPWKSLNWLQSSAPKPFVVRATHADFQFIMPHLRKLKDVTRRCCDIDISILRIVGCSCWVTRFTSALCSEREVLPVVVVGSAQGKIQNWYGENGLPIVHAFFCKITRFRIRIESWHSIHLVFMDGQRQRRTRWARLFHT